MFMKKAIVIGILTGSGAAALAQGPVGALPIQPPGGGGSPIQPNFSADPTPLTEGSTPQATGGVEFNIDEFLSGSARLISNSTSLPGLAQQTAEFVQNQGDSGGGPGADSLPSPEDLPDASQAEQLAESGGGNGGDSLPSGDDAPSQDDVPEQDDVVPTESELENRRSAMTPDGDEPDTFINAAEGFVDVVASAPDMLGGESDMGGAPGADDLPQGPGSDPQAPGLPDNGDGGAPDELSVAFSIPADLEDQAPVPMPFAPSSVVRAEVQLTARNPQGGEEPGTAPDLPTPDDLPQ